MNILLIYESQQLEQHNRMNNIKCPVYSVRHELTVPHGLN